MIGDKEDPVMAEVDKRLEKLFGESDESPGSGKGERSIEVSPLWDLKAIILSIDWEITDEIMTRLTEQIGRAKNAYNEDKTILLFLQLLDSVGKYIKTNKADTHPDAIKLLNSVYTSLEKVALSKGISSAEKEKTLLFEIKRFKKLKEHIALRKAETSKREETPPLVSEREVVREETPPPALEREVVREEVTEMIPEVRVEAEGIEAPFRDEAAAFADTLEETPSHDDLEPDFLGQEQEIELAAQEGDRLLGDVKDKAPASEMSGMAPHEAFSYALMEIKRTIKTEFEALRAELKLWRREK
ncbi:MAG: hypothetical protein BBJ60_11735 [Desulfobacterales bacterium S7086C20]|nr:MAG: hypothetical protein BBJ60_11735 [Desulfobacterales bacterium S7086C20]